MGQSKGAAKYNKLPTVSPEQLTYLQQALSRASGNEGAASNAYQEFLGQMSGANPIVEAANKNFQQQTMPTILNAYGTDNKGSSALNQALASGASNLNTNLASALAGMKLDAAQGLANLGASQGRLGAGVPTFAYQERQLPIWKSMLMGAGQGAVAGSSLGPWGALAGGIGGAGMGAIR